MRLLRAADHRRMAWKNGGGETVEIAVHPPEAGLADFDWRISTALVAADGPFSVFPGVDRTLVLLEGAGIDLEIDGGERHMLTAASDPLSFPADAPVTARLIGGPITDLNVMTRRGRWRHAVFRVPSGGWSACSPADGVMLVTCFAGEADVEAEASRVRLRTHDAVLMEQEGEVSVLAETGSRLWAATLVRDDASVGSAHGRVGRPTAT